jgi:hypothetical protein
MPKPFTYADREELIAEVKSYYPVHKLSLWEPNTKFGTKGSVTFEVDRNSSQPLTRLILQKFDVYVFAETEIFRYEHVVVSFKTMPPGWCFAYVTPPPATAPRVRIWSQDDFALYLLPPDGEGRCAYAFFDGGVHPIFQGADFKPSPLHPWHSDLAVAALLASLSLQPGDTDAEHFQDYTADQLAWAKRRGEELSWWVGELEGEDA